MSRSPRIVVVEADGVGPEVVAGAVAVVEACGIEPEWDPRPAGLACLARGEPVVPVATLTAIRDAGAALKGPFSTPSGGTQRSANFYIRRDLDLYACVRPIRPPGAERDVWLVRENVEDLYGAVEWMAAPGVAHAVKVATRAGCERIARFALDLALDRGLGGVTVVHKANNLKLTEGLFLDVAREVALDYRDLVLTDMLADTAASTLVQDPLRFEVLLTSNTFGDLLSNVGAAVEGSVGLVPSLNVGSAVVVAEASHGDAGELAGTGRANPVAMISAAGMLLESLGYRREGAAVRAATLDLRRTGVVTPDLGGAASTAEVTDEVVRGVRERLAVEAPLQ